MVVCIDGSAPGYIEAAIEAGVAPYFADILASCTHTTVDCVMPSFTNPNNMSIVTGVPPRVHGICGNYFLDPQTGNAIMMNDPKLLRAPTIFKALQDAITPSTPSPLHALSSATSDPQSSITTDTEVPSDASSHVKMAIITAKEKLRLLLGHQLDVGLGHHVVCFSAETASLVSVKENGIDSALGLARLPQPHVYSADLSEFVMAAGLRLLERERPLLTYLSTTDYVQHKHAPGSGAANAFYAMLDRYLGRMHKLGVIIVLTADHGMSDKHLATTGRPDVLYLQDLIDSWCGTDTARVILPITDPYVAHHGALGSYAAIYFRRPFEDQDALLRRLRGIEGIQQALKREEACALYDLPLDRTGDIVVIGSQTKVLGTRVSEHDLSQLHVPLRSHGGLSERCVPLITNRVWRLPEAGGRALRNFDAFDVALNMCA